MANKLISFMKEHHYVWEANMAGHYTYGPNGVRLKKYLINLLNKELVLNDFVEIETPLILHKNVWIKSGHWDKFNDPVVYSKEGKMYRLDKLLEEYIDPDFDFTKITNDNVSEYIELLNCKIKNDEDPLMKSENIQYKSLMMKTVSGNSEVGLRPETATATYAEMENIANYAKDNKFAKIYQIGKSFRNEISPKNLILRGREFTQAEAHIIGNSNDVDNTESEVMDMMCNVFNNTTNNIEQLNFASIDISPPMYKSLIFTALNIIKNLNILSTVVRLRRHRIDERAFYAKDAWDIEILLNGLGWTEIIGIHDRGTYDLRHRNKDERILELAMGVDRLFYAMMDSYYINLNKSDGKTILKIPYNLAPVKVSVLPLVKNKPDLIDKAHEWFKFVKELGITVEYDERSSIGKRYLRNNLKGIPFSITIDYDSLSTNTVTIRDRDTEQQSRITKQELEKFLKDYR